MNKLTIFAAIATTAAVFGTAGVLAQSNTEFGRADGNNDGKITPIEAQGSFPTLTKQLFDQADSNHDGVLDETEWGLVSGLMAGQSNNTSSQAAPDVPAPSSSSSSSAPSSTPPDSSSSSSSSSTPPPSI